MEGAALIRTQAEEAVVAETVSGVAAPVYFLRRITQAELLPIKRIRLGEARIAQLVEHTLCKVEVGGSIPSVGSNFFALTFSDANRVVDCS